MNSDDGQRATREVAALLAQMPSTEALAARRTFVCPDCGEPTKRADLPLCPACMAELETRRELVAAA